MNGKKHAGRGGGTNSSWSGTGCKFSPASELQVCTNTLQEMYYWNLTFL